MKTNKKAVLGFAIAMIFSLAIMQGNSMKSTKQDITMQQLTYVAARQAITSEGGVNAQVAWGLTASYGYNVTSGLAGAAYATGWCPVGWVIGAAAVVAAG